MKHNVLKALQPKKYFELLVEQEKLRTNGRSLGSHREITIEAWQGATVSVNLKDTVCLLSMSILPSKNKMNLNPKIEFSLSGTKTMHKDFLSQLINEQIKVEISEEQQGKIKLSVNFIGLFNLGGGTCCQQQWKCRDSHSLRNSSTCKEVQWIRWWANGWLYSAFEGYSAEGVQDN